MPNSKPPPKPPFKLSTQTGQMLADLSPAQREEAIRIAAKLLAIKAKKANAST